MLDLDGNVVGVIRAKLPETLMLEIAGTTGANYGFAIDATTLLDFLGPFTQATAPVANADLSVQQVVAKADDFTHQIRCER